MTFKTGHFTKGINYWPASKAMYWWENFDAGEVRADFEKLVRYSFQVVRIFLTWEHFQPFPEVISPLALKNLVVTANIAENCGLKIMPTFFCGHMSGVNWMPAWMLAGPAAGQRFPIYSGGKLYRAYIHNYYEHEQVKQAQVLQLRQVCSALKGHKAIAAYDLGNESSNCSIPTSRHSARQWLETMSNAIKNNSDGSPVTLGMHAEDLEEDRKLGPQEAGQFCDFLSMHGYPFYLSWVEDPLDVYLVPFLGKVTAWLGNKPVLFQEFGAPSYPVIPPLPDYKDENLKCPIFRETEVSAYYQKTLELLYRERMLGAFAWCFADYHPSLWESTPLNPNHHERHFGIFRHDGSAKPAAQAFLTPGRLPGDAETSPCSWPDGLSPDSFYQNPLANLVSLYINYKT